MCAFDFLSVVEVTRLAFVLAAIDAGFELVGEFGVMRAVVGGLGGHGGGCSTRFARSFALTSQEQRGG